MIFTDKYILDENGGPQPEPDLIKWATWFEASHRTRIVRQTTLWPLGRVSTIFLGLDHSFEPDPVLPVLWETMIFGGPMDTFCWRYTSREDAIAGHRRALIQLCSGYWILEWPEVHLWWPLVHFVTRIRTKLRSR